MASRSLAVRLLALYLHVVTICFLAVSAVHASIQMLTVSELHYVDIGHKLVRLDCQFHMDDFSLFVNPIYWFKRQLDDDAVPINFQGNILDPFLETKRFHTELGTSSDRRRYNPQLTIYDVALEDAGNYTCEVHGRRSSILASVTHIVHVTAPLREIYFTAPPQDVDPTNTHAHNGYSRTFGGGATYGTNDQNRDAHEQHSSDYFSGPSSSPSAPLHQHQHQPSAEVRVRQLTLTASVPAKLRCVAIGSGFPVPELRVSVSSRDVTSAYFHRRTTASFRPVGGGAGNGAGKMLDGLKFIDYRTELVTDSLIVNADDDSTTVRCSTLSDGSGIPPADALPPSASLYDAGSGMTEQSAVVTLQVLHVPRIECTDKTASVGDTEVFLRCEVVAKPQPSALYWVLQIDATTAASNDTDNERIGDGRTMDNNRDGSNHLTSGDGYYWTVATDRSDGCLEARLYIGKVVEQSFRWYTIIAENSIGTTKVAVRLSKDESDVNRQHRQRIGPPSAQQSKKFAKHAIGSETDAADYGDEYDQNDSSNGGGSRHSTQKIRGGVGGGQHPVRHQSTDRRSQFSSVTSADPSAHGLRSTAVRSAVIFSGRYHFLTAAMTSWRSAVLPLLLPLLATVVNCLSTECRLIFASTSAAAANHVLFVTSVFASLSIALLTAFCDLAVTGCSLTTDNDVTHVFSRTTSRT